MRDLARGIDMDLDGKPDSFLPQSLSADELAKKYRIVYRGPQSFKVLAK